jgi:hypothetical protein
MLTKIVEVRWIDTGFVGDELSIKDVMELKPLDMITFGALMNDDDSSVTVSFTVCVNDKGEGNEYRSTVVIPKVNVRSIKELGEVEV